MSRLQTLLRNPRDPSWYLLGETAHNHAGDLDYASRAVDDLCAMDGVHGIKIHMNLVLSSYGSVHFNEVEVYEKFIWTEAEHGMLFDKVKTAGKDLVVLANDMESLNYLIGRGDVDGIELHAVSMYDVPMLERLRDFDGVVVLGVGGTELDEIQRALDKLNAVSQHDVLLMYGFQNFPSRPEDVNLKRMTKVRDLFGLEVGYADHTSWDHPENAFISTIGYGMGCRVLEKHYSPTAGEERIDYQSSASKDVFDKIIERMELIRLVHGNGALSWSDAEKSYGRYGTMKKAMVAARDLPAGHVLTPADFLFKRTSRHVSLRQSDYDLMLGRTLAKAVTADHMITWAHIDGVDGQEG